MIITKIIFNQSDLQLGTFFSKSSESFVISSNTRTFYFCDSQSKPLQASKLSNLKAYSIFKQISVPKIQIFNLRKIKGHMFEEMTNGSSFSEKKPTFSSLRYLEIS